MRPHLQLQSGGQLHCNLESSQQLFCEIKWMESNFQIMRKNNRDFDIVPFPPYAMCSMHTLLHALVHFESSKVIITTSSGCINKKGDSNDLFESDKQGDREYHTPHNQFACLSHKLASYHTALVNEHILHFY